MANSNSNTNAVDAINREADRIEEDALFSAKGQWEAERGCVWLHYWLGIPATISASLAGVSVISEIGWLAAMLSILTAILAGLLTFLNPNARRAEHHEAGGAFKALSNDARIFRTVTCHGATTQSELEEMLANLNLRRTTLNNESPSPSRAAYKRAKKGIENGESKYRVDKIPSDSSTRLHND